MHRKLFLFGLLIFLLPWGAGAERLAVSQHYVQRVLDRADSGIAFARKDSSVWTFLEKNTSGYFSYAQHINSAILALVDTKLRVVEQERSLSEHTPCLRADLFLLELKMEQVRQELLKALDGGHFVTVWYLLKLPDFLNESYDALLAGATNPEFEDTAFYAQREFEESKPGWCCLEEGETCEQRDQRSCEEAGGGFTDTLYQCTQYQCTAPAGDTSEEKMCPFHSDYLPASLNGYGCDQTVLMEIIARLHEEHQAFLLPTLKEKNALEDLEEKLQTYLKELRGIVQLQEEIDSIIDDRPAEKPKPEEEEITHKRRMNCAIQGTFCSGDPTVACKEDDDCRRGGKGLCIDGSTIGICERAQNVRCVTDSDCEKRDAGTCLNLAGAVRQDVRGPFAIDRSEWRILRAFLELRTGQALQRETPRYFKASPDKNGLESVLDRYGTEYYGSFSQQQARSEALLFTAGSDSVLQRSGGLRELQDSVRALAVLARDPKKGLRAFVRDYAYFLRRSCLQRPCNKRLEQVLRIVFQDDCFPYTNGEYLSEEAGNPMYEKCKEKAGITVKP